MKFEDIQWKKGDKIQDSDSRWWTFVEDRMIMTYPMLFKHEGGVRFGFTRKGWYAMVEEDDTTKLHLLPETYQPVKDTK